MNLHLCTERVTVSPICPLGKSTFFSETCRQFGETAFLPPTSSLSKCLSLVVALQKEG